MRVGKLSGELSSGRTIRLLRLLGVTAVVALVPSLAHAQSSIAGTIRDASGAVLPGVTVEVASPVLIEKVRSTVSDGTGQYRLADLLPGTYTVTYTLTGFATVKRDAVQVTGAGVMTLNADMRVGTLQETITVTGETPVVDTQSTRRQETVSRGDAQGAPGDTQLQRARVSRAVGDRRQQPDRLDARDADLLQPRRARERGAHVC